MKLAYILLLTLSAIGCGYGSKYNPQTGGTGAAAIVSTLMPSTSAAGGPGFILTINGTSFANNSVVYFGGAAASTMFVTANQLMATVPASAIASAGTKPVYVNSAGNIYGANSNTVNFTVN